MTEKRKKWTSDDDRFLAFYYGECGISADMLAEDLGRSEGSVRQRLLKLGVRAPAWKRSPQNRSAP